MEGHSDRVLHALYLWFSLLTWFLMSTYNTSRECMGFFKKNRMARMLIFRSLDNSERHHARTHHILNKNRSDNLDIDIGQWGLDPLGRLLFSRGTVVHMRDI